MFWCVSVSMCLRHHFITSYIILHHLHKNGIRSRFSENIVKVTRSKLRITASSVCTQKRDISFQSMDIFIFYGPRIFFLYEAWKEGKVFFRRRIKNGMYVSFMHHKEINYNNLHIRSKVTHIKYYSFITIKAQCPL